MLDRTEEARAEQAVAFRLERPVVDGLGLLDPAERPRADALRRGDPDLDLVERLRLGDRVGEVGQFIHRVRPSLKIQPLSHFGRGRGPPLEERSEEHTSELQSLMRISYAVFCLKKKKK